MRLRPYRKSDAALIQNWIQTEREHAMWCANRIPYPFEEEAFNRLLKEGEEQWSESAFTAVKDDGTPIGFFGMSVNEGENSGFLRFVILDVRERGKGAGSQMMKLAVQYAFTIANVSSLSLTVFRENQAAARAYGKAGFWEIPCEMDSFSYGEEKWDRCRMIKTC